MGVDPDQIRDLIYINAPSCRRAYAYVNHNLIEALVLGATAHVQVEGQWNNDLMKQILAPTALF
jgi:hypothetical protein